MTRPTPAQDAWSELIKIARGAGEHATLVAVWGRALESRGLDQVKTEADGESTAREALSIMVREVTRQACPR
jgi:hypothetical protein